MPLPNMTRIQGSESINITDLIMSLSTNSTLTHDQWALVNSTMTTLFSPEKHCAFPVYSLAKFIIIFPTWNIGFFVIVTVTAIVMYCKTQ